MESLALQIKFLNITAKGWELNFYYSILFQDICDHLPKRKKSQKSGVVQIRVLLHSAMFEYILIHFDTF